MAGEDAHLEKIQTEKWAELFQDIRRSLSQIDNITLRMISLLELFYKDSRLSNVDSDKSMDIWDTCILQLERESEKLTKIYGDPFFYKSFQDIPLGDLILNIDSLIKKNKYPKNKTSREDLATLGSFMSVVRKLVIDRSEKVLKKDFVPVNSE